jgi:hypothetical protein
MNDNKNILEQFRDLKITKNELYSFIQKEFKTNQPVEVCSVHLVTLLLGYQKGSINEQNILDWVNTIWFSDWFMYCEEQCDSIASVMNQLEEIDEEGKKLTKEKVANYINALGQNIEI